MASHALFHLSAKPTFSSLPLDFMLTGSKSHTFLLSSLLCFSLSFLCDFPPSFATVVTVGQVVPDFYPYLKKEQLPETKVNDKENNSQY